MLIAAGIWNTASLVTQENLEAEHRARQHAQDAEDDIQNACVRLEPAAMSECIKEIIEASAEAQRGERDLSAQKVMAYWAGVMVAISTVTLIVTAAGVYFVWRTLRGQLDALNIELLPFLTVEIIEEGKIEWTPQGFKVDGEGVAEIWMTIANAGKSPAIVRFLGRKWVVAKNDSPPITPAHDSVKTRMKNCDIPIGGGSKTSRIRTQLRQFTDDGIFVDGIIPDFYTGRSVPHFVGRIEFKDISGNEYVCGFSLVFYRGHFIVAWPDKEPERYNYQYRVDEKPPPVSAYYGQRRPRPHGAAP